MVGDAIRSLLRKNIPAALTAFTYACVTYA